MTHCSNCFKQIPCEVNSSNHFPDHGYKSMMEDREMSRFLYRLTQEIVTSRDYSDANISRICDKYFRSAVYPDKKRLARTIVDLKRKLLMDVKDTDVESLEMFEEPDGTNDKLKGNCIKVSDKHFPTDESTSVQSFGKLPGMLVNSTTQFPAEPVKSSQRSGNQSLETLQKCLTEADVNSRDSISTITTYNFSSPPYSPCFTSSRRESARSREDDEQTLIGQLLSCSRGDRLEDGAAMDGCCGRNKNSVDSSADMVMRMAASDRVFRGDATQKKCPLKRCQHFAQSPPCGGGSGGCGGGCASDFPLPKLPEAEESPEATCCGKKKKKRTNGGKKKDGGRKDNKKEGNRSGRK